VLHVRLTELHAAHQNLPPAIRTCFVTTESSISHCFNITGWHKYAY